MRMWAKGTVRAALLTASFVALGAGPALAGTDGRDSVLGGNQINLPISVPVNASGNAVGVLGHAEAASTGGESVASGGNDGETGHTSGRHSIGGGNQISAPISAPINLCGNAIGVLGSGLAGCTGGSSVTGSGSGSGYRHTSGRHSVLGGNQVDVPINVPVNACGNAVGLLGSGAAACEGGVNVTRSGSAGESSGNRTSGRDSIGGGNQVDLPINVPVNACGNAIGRGAAACTGGASTSGGSGGGYRHTSGGHSIGGGNQVNAPISAPINICGNTVGLLGSALGGCQTSSGSTSPNACPSDCPSTPSCPSDCTSATTPPNSCPSDCTQATTPPVTTPPNSCPSDCTPAATPPVTTPPNSCPSDCTPAATPPNSCPSDCTPVKTPPNSCPSDCTPAATPPSTCPSDCYSTAASETPMSSCPDTVGGSANEYGSCDNPCVRTSSADRHSTLSGLPVDPASLRKGVLPVSLGSMSSLANLPGQKDGLTKSNARLSDVAGVLPGALPVPAADSARKSSDDLVRPMLPGLRNLPLLASAHGMPLAAGAAKQLPPVVKTAAESPATTEHGTLAALALGGMLAGSAGITAAVRRLRRR